MTDGEPGAKGAAPRFAAGDLVRTRAADPVGHTRLPRYVRGHTGRVVEVTGSWPLADDVAARSTAPRVEPVYTVAFSAAELWAGSEGRGESGARVESEGRVGSGSREESGARGDEVTVDLWQSYLEPVRRSEA